MIERRLFVWSVNDAWAMLAASRCWAVLGCAIRVENKAGISSGDKSELIRRRTRKQKLSSEVILARKIYLPNYLN